MPFSAIMPCRVPKILRRLTEETKSKTEKGKKYAQQNKFRYADKPPDRNFSDVGKPVTPNKQQHSRSSSGILPKIKKTNSNSSDITPSVENFNVLPTMEGSGLLAKPTRVSPKSGGLGDRQNSTLRADGTKKAPKQIVDVKSLLQNAIQHATEEAIPASDGVALKPDERLLKPLGAGITDEYRSLAATISKEIYLENPNVKFSDIIGLEKAKKFVKESVVYPIKYPQLFQGSKLLSPWKGLLLYGPPGTGKTMLAKAVATECNTTFFNISASSIVSKWRGDSEKLVRVLFELARFHAPSTIFIDEIDSIMSTRDASDHEGSKRMKTELLIQMDGLNSANSFSNVFVLCASNLPWSLDVAMLRRLEKRIFVNLPNLDARKSLFQHYLLENHSDSENQEFLEKSNSSPIRLDPNVDFDLLAEKTENYSGADIFQICKESAMQTLRKIFDVLEDENVNKNLDNLKLDPIRQEVLDDTILNTKSATVNNKKYEKWAENFDTK